MRELILVLAVAACSDPSGPREPIAIGFLAPLTGDIAAFGRDLTDASNLALEEINNDGGVLSGTEFRLIVYDTGTSATGAQIGYTALLNQGVPVILGPTASSEAVAIREQVKAGTTLTMSQSTTSPQLADLDFGGYFFRLAPSDAVQSIVLSSLINTKALTGLCVVHRDDPYGNGLLQAVQSRVTVPITTAKYDPALADLSHVLDPCDPLITGTKSGILFITLVADGAQLIDDAARRGWNPTTQQVFLTDGTRNRDLVTILANPSFIEGALGTAATGPDPNGPDGVVLRDFRGRFRDRFGRDSDVYGEMAYDAMYVTAMAIELARSSSNRTAIREALSSIASGEVVVPGDWAKIRGVLDAAHQADYRGASGEVAFDLATGDIRGPFFISVWTISNGAVTEIRVERIDPT